MKKFQFSKNSKEDIMISAGTFHLQVFLFFFFLILCYTTILWHFEIAHTVFVANFVKEIGLILS